MSQMSANDSHDRNCFQKLLLQFENDAIMHLRCDLSLGRCCNHLLKCLGGAAPKHYRIFFYIITYRAPYVKSTKCFDE